MGQALNGWRKRLRGGIWVAGAIYAVCAAEFVFDISVDQRIAFGIFYLPMVGTAVFYRNRRAVWLLAALASVLVAIGFWLPVVNENAVEAAINRMASIAAIWVIAALVDHSRGTQAKLAAQTKRAEQADRAKTELFTKLSRELIAPLNSIAGFSELLLTECAPEQREYLTFIHVGGKKLLNTFRNLIDLTQTGERRLQSVPVNLLQVTTKAAKAAMVEAAPRGVAIVLPEDDAATLAVQGDPWAVRRIADNLLSNAVKFSNPGSTVTVVLGQAGNGVTLRIADTGVGMQPDVIARLGELFFQAHPGTARHYEGMGAGLALSMQLAAAMGGAIRFDSQRGAGTTAILTMPVARRASAPIREPALSAEPMD